jgi:hypothetical protein
VPFVIHVPFYGVVGCAKARITLCCSANKSMTNLKKDFDDFIITSWDFVGNPFDSAPDELPFPWAVGPCFAGKFSGLFGGEQRLGFLRYPVIFTGNFRLCRKMNLLSCQHLAIHI